jgi:hypothetical protein
MRLLSYIAEAVGATLSPYGFELVEPSGSAYEARRLVRGNLSIGITYDPRNGEIDVSLTDIPTGSRVPFWILGDLTGDRQAALVGSTGVQNDEDAQVAAALLTKAFQRHLQLLLDWNDETAGRLSEAMEALSRDAWKKQRIADAMAKAELCWTEKRYADYVSEVTPFAAELSPAGRKRLMIAQKRLEPAA